MTVKDLYEYWKGHQTDYPVAFELCGDSTLDMVPADRMGSNIRLDNKVIAGVDSYGQACVKGRVFSIEERCAKAGYDYDLENPGDYLRAYIDCVYLELAIIRVWADKCMSYIDGEE